MSKFKVTETYGCWVSWSKIVEADTSFDAYDKYMEGKGVAVENECPEIGDCIDGYDTIDPVVVPI